MLRHASLSPAFGHATLDNCEQEQIHLAGSIQPHGALLVLHEPQLSVVQASTNLNAILGFGPAEVSSVGHGWCNGTLDTLAPDLAAAIRPHVGEALDVIPLAVRCRLGSQGQAFDLLLHRVAQAGLVVEVERAGPPLDLPGPIEAALRTIVSVGSLTALCDEAAWVFRDLTGYDRVMVYRFDEEGHGAVVSEQRRPDLEALLGNRYPSTDIPHIARRLYERNRVRVLTDVHYTPVPVMPRRLPDGGELDMSLCVLRSSSPIHVQYLKNMGVSATLVISLMVSGRLWGLISCHHMTPREFHFEKRAVCEVLAEAVSTRIAALESFVQSQVELSVRRIEQRIIESISRDGDWRIAMFDGSNSILAPLGATGAALLFEGQCLTVGEVPGTLKLREIGQWLDDQARAGVPRTQIFASAALSVDAPRFTDIADVASGLLAATVSNELGEYLIWFRPEQVRTVTWGGDPSQAVVVGASPQDLSPRRSFAQWHQRVEATSAAWSSADLTAARLIGETVTDVVLQFRAVRMLIAQDQLEQVQRQVRQSDQPVIVADETGRFLLMNAAFERLLAAVAPSFSHMDDLPGLFHNEADVARRLADLRALQRTWRGEVMLKSVSKTVGSNLPVLGRAMFVRADPVLSAPGFVLGYVMLFTDLTERKDAEAARRIFQEGIVQRSQAMASRANSRTGIATQSLLASMLENAQLAALEITDGVDTKGMSQKLNSVRSSVERATEMLDRLIRHSGATS